METFATLFGSLLAFVYHCFDRIVILGHIPLLTRPENIVHFFRDLHHSGAVTKDVLRKRTDEYRRWVDAFARHRRIPVEWAEHGVRKEDYVRPHLRQMERHNRFGVYFILKSMEVGPTFRSSSPKYPSADPHYRIIARQRCRYTHYYFYIRDQGLGPMSMCVGSFLPFQITYYLNGHHFIERELIRNNIAFRKDDNAFLAVDDPKALQAAADRLSAEIIRKRLDYWTWLVGPKFSRKDREQINLSRHYSIQQVEYCRNLIFRRHFPIHKFNRNDAFTALNGFQPRTPGAKPPRLNRNQFGANLGGPVWLPKLYKGQDKTFFFFNWESGRQIAGSFGGQALLPPSPLRTGDFSGVPNTIDDPQTGVPFPNNVIPSSRIAGYARKFLDGFVPAPNTSEPGINYRGPRAAAPIDQDQYTGRIDHMFSSRDTLNGSYMYNIQSDDTVPTFRFDTRGNRARGQNLSVSETHLFSGAVINELRAGWHRFFEHEFFGTTARPEFDVANIIGIPGVSKDPRNFGPPTFSAGYTLPTVRGIGPRDRLNQLWQVSDNLSLRKGTHFLKFGGLLARRNWTFDESVNPRGSFDFLGTVTAGGTPTRDNSFAEFLLGLATGAQVSAEPFATRMNNFWHAYYFQDDWKVSPTLTLNFGLRYEYFSPPVQRGKATNFDLNGFIPVRQTFHGFPDIPDTKDRPAALVYPDRNDFGPRLGFAWLALKDLVVRGGYGIYYTPEITNSWTTLTLNPPIVRTFTFTGSANNPINVATAFQGQGQTRAGLFGSGALDPNIRSTYTQQWNLAVQKKLPREVYFDISYVGSKGTNLTATFDSNRPIALVVPGPDVPAIAARRPFPGFDTISTTKSIANSTYHSLQMKAERRVGRGLTLLASYTWSKSLSNADISSVGGGSFLAGIQDYFNLRGDRSYSVFDIPHRLSLAAIYDVPLFASAHGAVRTLLGGWQLGTIVTEQTGFASTLSGVPDTTGTGLGSRLDAVAGQKAMLDRGQRTRARWFNTAAFTFPQPGRFGTAPRHPIHLPGLNQVDFSANKNFRFGERHQVQFRAEFFNFLNHVNLGAPGLNIRDPDNFGRVISTNQGAAGMPGDARIVQFGLKYAF